MYTRILKTLIVTLLFCLFFIGTKNLYAQEVLVLSEKKGVMQVGSHTLLFEDKAGKETIESVLKPGTQKKFVASDGDATNFNVTSSVIWAKMRFTTQETNDWYVEYGMPAAQFIEFYQLIEKGYTLQQSGIEIPPATRVVLGHRGLFRLKLQKGDTVECYLRVRDHAPMRFIIRAASLKSFFKQEHGINFWHGAFYGIMMLMAIYNLFLFITNRNRVYLYYVLYVVFSSLFIAYFNGYAATFSESVLAVLSYLPTAAPALFGIFGLLFTMEFLYTKKYAPRMHRFIIGFMISVSIPTLIPVFGYPHLGVIIIQFYGLVLSVVSITTGIVVFRKGFRPAKFYIIGFGSYMTGLMIVILGDFIAITNEFVSMYSFQTGAAIEAVILSFAIGDKLNNANRDKTIAQAKALEESQKNEKLIREQNTVLEQKVKERTHELEEQKLVVEEKNKEITDSINYAKRIQEAILPSAKRINELLPHSFILYKPKDIVAGDFYFVEKTGDTVIFAAADCTGHGVPGAMVSVVCANALNRALKEFNLTNPAKILDKVRELVIETLDKSESSVRDGMDISLCALNTKTNAFHWAGANNPLVIIRDKQLIEFAPDKMPIGRYEKNAAFTSHNIEIQKGDTLYLYSDGYSDQFGGPKGKKFKESNLHKLLLMVNELPLAEQKNRLDSAIEEWKGNLEQLDDICVMGINI